MRDLKFRAWDKDEKRFNYIDIEKMFDAMGADYGLNQGQVDFMDSDIQTIMQYTGLFDDTGRKIYEGDIVEIQNKLETKTSYKSIVMMSYNGAIISAHPAHIKIGEKANRQLSSFCDYGFGGKYDVECKIVGNVYENSDLLKEVPRE